MYIVYKSADVLNICLLLTRATRPSALCNISLFDDCKYHQSHYVCVT